MSGLVAQWYNHREAYERYNYLYSQSELEEWLPRIKELGSRAGKVFVSFNNHFQGKAVVNGQM